ncbi:uncharacterized protein [Haliotis asinina]|uniref:uncharacterized protein n=1 Tax=Haliotis asinina TaxID=109174 RepID=UPI003531E33B
MHLKCLQSGICVPRDVVMLLLQILDPEGVEARKRRRLRRRQYLSRGPNNVWHIDSYDKLKPYGMAINGCIDGFSRNIIWLDVCKTNSDPKVIAGYYIGAVQRLGGCPQRIRADMGSENSYVEQMQIFLRRNHEDDLSGANSFMYGKSTHNQRIEWFWGILRKQLAQYWMDLFKSFQDEEDTQFCGDLLDKSLIQHCFMELIQNDLDNLQTTWNSHSISSKTNAIRQGNRPVMMYSLPELFDKEDCLCAVDVEEVYMCSEETLPKNERMCDETVKELCSILMEEQGLDYPDNVDDAVHLYKCLRREIRLVL